MMVPLVTIPQLPGVGQRCCDTKWPASQVLIVQMLKVVPRCTHGRVKVYVFKANCFIPKLGLSGQSQGSAGNGSPKGNLHDILPSQHGI